LCDNFTDAISYCFSGSPAVHIILPLTYSLSFLSIIFKIPPVPSASYLAEAMCVSTRSIWHHLVLLWPSLPLIPTNPEGFPCNKNTLRYHRFHRAIHFPSTSTETLGTLQSLLNHHELVDPSDIINLLSKRISTVVSAL
jgi:hypothetical protein